MEASKMLNVNSPTVQAMMNNIPQGVGNMPVYFGSAPTITQETQQPISTPYPSPKEMLIQSGQQNIYQPTTFGRNIVGSYNPAFDMMFNGYSNPYMGGYVNPYPAMPMDPDTRLTYEMACYNQITYQEQLTMESNIYKAMSRVVSKSLNRSEEEAKKCEAKFDIYDRTKVNTEEVYYRKPTKMMRVTITFSDGHKKECDPDKRGYYRPQYVTRPDIFSAIEQRAKAIKDGISRMFENMHSSAVERKMDNLDIIDFFNNGIGSIISKIRDYELDMQLKTNSSFMYNRNKFKDNLLKNNGYKVKDRVSAIERFTGRYGVMPDGRPVSPGHDPSVAESFSYNPSTGQYSVTAPNFIANRMEQARARFIQSIS